MPVSFRSELFTSYILTIFKQWNLLPLIWKTAKYSYSCMLKYYRKMKLLKMCGPHIRLCLFTFRSIASKHLNSLSTIDTFSWLGGAVVTHQRSRVQFPAPARVFMFDFFVLLLLCFYFLSKTTFFVTIFCDFFCNVSLFRILNILPDLRPIMRV